MEVSRLRFEVSFAWARSSQGQFDASRPTAISQSARTSTPLQNGPRQELYEKVVWCTVLNLQIHNDSTPNMNKQCDNVMHKLQIGTNLDANVYVLCLVASSLCHCYNCCRNAATTPNNNNGRGSADYVCLHLRIDAVLESLDRLGNPPGNGWQNVGLRCYGVFIFGVSRLSVPILEVVDFQVRL